MIIFEDIFDWNLGIWNAPPIYLELKGDAKPVCSFPYTGLKAHKFMLKKSYNNKVLFNWLIILNGELHIPPNQK